MTEFNFEKWKAETPVVHTEPEHPRYGWYHPEDYPTPENFERHIRDHSKYYWQNGAWIKRDDQWFTHARDGSCPYDPECYNCGTSDASSFLYHSRFVGDEASKQALEFFKEQYDANYECIDCLQRRINPSKLWINSPFSLTYSWQEDLCGRYART